MTELTEKRLRTEDLASSLGLEEPPPDVLDRLESAGHARNGFCETCWADAVAMAKAEPDRTQVEHYIEAVGHANRAATIRRIQ